MSISRAPVRVSRWHRKGDRGYPGLLTVALVAVSALLVFVPAASADLSFGLEGSGAGQTSNPQGIAVDASNGDLYVADKGNNRVDVFESSGVFLFAFGWKVNATTPEEKLQTCTVLTGCQQGSAGAGAGQLNSPGGIAVDSASHDVYVAEGSNQRVQKFDASGGFLLMFGKNVNTGTSGKPNLCTSAGPPADVCGVGGEGEGAGQFDSIKGIGVGSGGAVYVVDTKNLGGCLIVGVEGQEFAKRVQKFSPSGEAIEQVLPTGTPCGGIEAFAVDSSGNLYIANTGGTAAARKYDPAGNPVVSWGEGGKVDSTPSDARSVALDAAGDFFVADGTSEFGKPASKILEYDPTGVQLRAFYGALKREVVGLAVFHTGTGDVFATEQEGVVQQVAVPPLGPLILQGCEATGIGNSRATLKCEVNPEGKATEYRFQYVDDATFQHDVAESGPGHGFDHAGATLIEAIPLPGGSSFLLQEVVKQLPLESLAPETTYHFRLLASNADAPGGNPGPEGSFVTLGPPEVLGSWATDVGTDSARVHAEVDPLLLATTGYFQYVDDATYRADVEASGPGHGFDHAMASPDVPGGVNPIDFGHGEGAIAGAAQLYPLAPGTVYHYRLVADDPFAPVFGPERTLRTFALSTSGSGECSNQAFRIGPSAVLPDCRAYELVSPLEKDNGDIRTLTNVTGFSTMLDQSAVDGAGFAYSSYRAFADPQGAPYTNQYLARRDPSRGWLSANIDPPRGPQIGAAVELEDEYKAFSSNLSSGWLLQEGEPRLDQCAPVGYIDLYHRNNADGDYQALSCAQPSLAPGVFLPELEGFSTDGSHAVVRIDDALTPDASGATTGTGGEERPVYQVYESTGAGGLRLVSVLPDGEASNDDSGAGFSGGNTIPNKYRSQSVVHAVSADGSRVFWSAIVTGGGGFGPIYLRENADREQSLDGSCDEPEKACTIPVSESVTSASARFQAGSVDGTKAIFTVEAGPLKGNLYEFDAATEQSHLIAEKTLGSILGSSDDGSRIFFASGEASVQAQSEGAVKGQPNVYLDDGGTIRFVGLLSAADANLHVTYGNPIATTPVYRTARVSPDGLHLVFMSDSKALSERVAGYDNTDVKNGEADAEVYQYDATANDGLGRLRCVSCNPTGALPSGRELKGADNTPPGVGEDPWVAASVPRFESDLYQPRYLSDDGNRVYFDSYEALVPRDTNGKEDVYQWEAAGTGGCTTNSSSYVPSSEGCLDLISSGQSNEDSEFLDASSSGSDVFFTTGESLLSYDPGLVDVYDARVGGGFPPPASPPVVCEGEACQGAPVPPLDTTPASFAFFGPGSPPPSPVLATPKAKAKPKVKPCRKGTVRKKGKCVVVKKKGKGSSAKAGRAGKSSRPAVKHNRRAAR